MSGKGSTSNTSSPAPAIRRSSSASTSAASSTRPPRAVLIRKAVGFISAEPPCVDQVARLGGQRRVQRDEVGLAQELVELDQAVAETGHGVGLGDRVRDQHLHVEAQAALGDRPADAAEADDAGRGLVQPAVDQGAPGARTRAPVVLDDPVRGGRHQGHRRGRPRRRGWCRTPWPPPRRGGWRRRGRPASWPTPTRATTLSAGAAANTALVVGLEPGDRRDDAVEPLDQLGLGEDPTRARSSGPRSRPRLKRRQIAAGTGQHVGSLHRTAPRRGGATGRSSRTLASAT